MQFIIREANENDLVKISEIEKLSFGESAWGYYFLKKFLELKFNKIIVAQNVDILGFCAFSDEGIIHIKKIAVHPNYRRKGVGEALLNEVLKYKKDVYLEVRISNEPAIKLYEKLGFRRITTLKSYYSNGEDAYRYYFKSFTLK